MNKEKIIQLARDAGLTDPDLGDWMTDYGYAENAILKFTSAIIAATKEEDAKICDLYKREFVDESCLNDGRHSDMAFGKVVASEHIAETIRASKCS